MTGPSAADPDPANPIMAFLAAPDLVGHIADLAQAFRDELEPLESALSPEDAFRAGAQQMRALARSERWKAPSATETSS